MTLSRLNWILAKQFGIDLKLLFRGLIRSPWFFKQWLYMQLSNREKISLMPCLHDQNEESGEYKHEYFWQDLFVAQQIYLRNPDCHIDVGSRLDGFVSHVASFRQLEILDIRPQDTQIWNVRFRQCDIAAINPPLSNVCDSLSCLHTLEHFGLGRYGDRIEKESWRRGLRNLSHALKQGGHLYLSTPVGQRRIYFNAHRIFDYQQLNDEIESNGLQVEGRFCIDPKGRIPENLSHAELGKVTAESDYTLVLFIARKI